MWFGAHVIVFIDESCSSLGKCESDNDTMYRRSSPRFTIPLKGAVSKSNEHVSAKQYGPKDSALFTL